MLSLLDLPTEILLLIIDLLDFPGLLNAAQLCRLLHSFALTEYFQRLGLSGDQHYAELCSVEFDKGTTEGYSSPFAPQGVQRTNARLIVDGLILARSSAFHTPPIRHLHIQVPVNQSLVLDKSPEIQRLMARLDYPSLIDEITIEMVDFDNASEWIPSIGICLTDLIETLVSRCKTFTLRHQTDLPSISFRAGAWMKPEPVSAPALPWYRLWARGAEPQLIKQDTDARLPTPRETLKFLDFAADLAALSLYDRPWSLPIPFTDTLPAVAGLTSVHIHNLHPIFECNKLLSEVSFPNLIKCNLGGILCSFSALDEFLRRHPTIQFLTRYAGRLGHSRGSAAKKQRSFLPALTTLTGDPESVAHILSLSTDDDHLPSLKAIRILIDNTVSFKPEQPPSFLPLFLIANRMKRHPVGTLSLTFMSQERLNEWLHIEDNIDEWLDIDYNLDAWLDIEYNLEGIRGRRIVLHRIHSLEFQLHKSIQLDPITLDRIFAWIRRMFPHLQSLSLQYESSESLSARVLVHAKEVRNLLHLWVNGDKLMFL